MALRYKTSLGLQLKQNFLSASTLFLLVVKLRYFVPMDYLFSCAQGNRPVSLCAMELSSGAPSPDIRLTDTSGFLKRVSRSPSLYSTCSAQGLPPTPPNSALRLPQVPIIPSIRHRTPQACDKCRERKTKVGCSVNFEPWTRQLMES